MKLLLENWRRFLKEDEQEYEIYCDMDGVLVDFERGVVEHITKALAEGRADELKAKIDRDYITSDDLSGSTKNKDVRDYMREQLKDDLDFWENLPWMSNGPDLWAAIAPYSPNILTTPMGYGSELGKQAWINKNLKPPPPFEKVFMSDKKYLWAKKNRILIDDWTKNTDLWKAYGGKEILYKDSEIEKTLKRLRKLGFKTN